VVAARIRLGGRQRVRSAMRRGAPLVSDDVFRFGGGGKGKGREERPRGGREGGKLGACAGGGKVR
jgi:hypothetical protein